MDRTRHGQCTHLVPDAAIAEVARPQYGVFTRGQAREVRFTRSQIDWRIRTGIWVVVDHCVYRLAATPPTWKQRLMAACIAGPAVASHRSAGVIWDLPGMPDDLIEVTALRHRRRRNTDVVWHESYHLTERDITEIEGIPTTRPTRTFLDLGVVLSADELEIVLNEGIRRNLLSVSVIARRLEELGRLRLGTAVVRAVLDRQDPGQRAPESVLETRFLQLIRSSGLPEPVPQLQVRLGNRGVARIDFAYPDRMIAIELDGAAHHTGEVAEKRDRRRDNQLGRLGWRVFHFDWGQVTRTPGYVLEILSESA